MATHHHPQLELLTEYAAGTLSLEFGTLSRLTGDAKYEQAALRATRAVWRHRSAHDLLGAHIHLQSGSWTQATPRTTCRSLAAIADDLANEPCEWLVLLLANAARLRVGPLR